MLASPIPQTWYAYLITLPHLGIPGSRYYIHIPVNFQNPTDQDFNQFCAVMEQLKDVPVHVHCIANARVSAFFYRYRRDLLGMDETQARAEMEAVWRPNAIWAAFVARRSERRDQ
jgi:hypothetical protein